MKDMQWHFTNFRHDCCFSGGIYEGKYYQISQHCRQHCFSNHAVWYHFQLHSLLYKKHWSCRPTKRQQCKVLKPSLWRCVISFWMQKSGLCITASIQLHTIYYGNMSQLSIVMTFVLRHTNSVRHYRHACDMCTEITANRWLTITSESGGKPKPSFDK